MGAGLLMRTFRALLRVDLGFDVANVVVVPFGFPAGQYAKVEQQQVFVREAVERVRALPGVVAVAHMVGWPAPFGAFKSEVQVSGRPTTERAVVRMCSESYLQMMGLRLVDGRAFAPEDVRQARKVAIVNEALVKGAFPGRNPIGNHVTLPALSGRRDAVKDPTFEIVGVVRDVRNFGIREEPSPEVLLPSTLSAGSGGTIVARTSRDPAGMLETIRREVKRLDRSVAVRTGGVLETEMRDAFHAQPRFVLLVLSAFAATGLVLVAMGIYGVLAYTVSRQVREIAVRMALGAGRKQVLGFVLGLGMRLVAGGVLIGALASIGTNRLLVNQLWNTSAHDPLTFALAIGAIVVVGLAACYVPAARAVRVDPMSTLRSE
jgi:predicted permease